MATGEILPPPALFEQLTRIRSVGGLISCYLYFPQNAAGGYKEANTWLMVAALLCVVLAGACWLYQVRENKLRAAGGRDYRLDGLNADEISLLGHRHPEFRYSEC